jgi:hypothetical protein
MHDEFLNQKHGTFFFIAILDGFFFALTVFNSLSINWPSVFWKFEICKETVKILIFPICFAKMMDSLDKIFLIYLINNSSFFPFYKLKICH